MWIIKGNIAINLSELKQIRTVKKSLREHGSVLLLFFDSLSVPSLQIPLESNETICKYLRRIKSLENDNDTMDFVDFVEEMNRI